MEISTGCKKGMGCIGIRVGIFTTEAQSSWRRMIWNAEGIGGIFFFCANRISLNGYADYGGFGGSRRIRSALIG